MSTIDDFNSGNVESELNLTAYALGELSGAEHSAVERRLEHDADARQFVEQTRRTADSLSRALSAEPQPQLTAAQRQALLEEPAAARPLPFNAARQARLWFGAGFAAAACLAIAVGAVLVSSGDSSPTEQAPYGTLAGTKPLEGSAVNEPLGQPRPSFTGSGKDKQMASAGQDATLGAGRSDPASSAPLGGAQSAGDATLIAKAPVESVTDSAKSERPGASPESNLEGLAAAPFAARAAPLTESASPVPPAPSAPAPSTSGPRGYDQTAIPGKRSPSARRSAPGGDAGGGFGGGMGGGGGAPEPPGRPGMRGASSTSPAVEKPSYGGGHSQLSLSVTDINERLAWAQSNLQTIQAALDQANRTLEGVSTRELENRARELRQQRQAVEELIGKLREEATALEARRRLIERPSAEAYNPIVDNPFVSATEHPLSTFSTDVDTASYANLRRYIMQNNQLPPADAVRIEEMLNYFRCADAPPAPEAAHPIAVHVEVNQAPWDPSHRLARITLKAREMRMDQRPATSLVFLIDVSGSMQPPNKLPLLRQSMLMLLDQLHGDDRVAIVTYAGNSGLALPSTYVSNKQAIVDAIDNLRAGGSTNGGAGIMQAYDVAVQNFISGGVNRVILATDGDFNVGVSDDASLIRLIEEKRATGVFLSVLGFGEGNLKDGKMEQLADKGNGAYAYIDSLNEGRKVLVEQATGTLVTVAKDVKLQVEFNPLQVSSYRLIGYENRVLAREDFNNDRKDAGDVGAGLAVTALYELVPAGGPGEDEAGTPRPPVDPLKYQKPTAVPSPAAATGELMTVKLRCKQPDGEMSRLLEVPVRDTGGRLDQASSDFHFASAVASFGMMLRNSPYRGGATSAGVLDLAEAGLGADSGGYRSEFIDIVKRAAPMLERQPRGDATPGR